LSFILYPLDNAARALTLGDEVAAASRSEVASGLMLRLRISRKARNGRYRCVAYIRFAQRGEDGAK
jgi:hypothetical protein